MDTIKIETKFQLLLKTFCWILLIADIFWYD